MNNKKKKFIFPENIDSKYSVFLGLSLKELVIYVLPAIVIGIIIVVVFPPHTFYGILIKIFFALIAVTMVIAVISSNPITERPNVKLIPYLKLKRQYNKRQQLYFKDTKKGYRE